MEGVSTKCISCFSQNIAIISIPCYHACLCKGCSENEKICPLCKMEVQMIFKFENIKLPTTCLACGMKECDEKECYKCERQICLSCVKKCSSCESEICEKCQIHGICKDCVRLKTNKDFCKDCHLFNKKIYFKDCRVCKGLKCFDCFENKLSKLSHPEICGSCLKEAEDKLIK